MDYDGSVRGLILDVGHGTMRDGPGWRSVIYFKGCNFQCRWCGAPDTISHDKEILFYPERVKYPDRLAGACPHHALRRKDSTILLDRKICRDCETYDCARVCVDGSIELAGREVTVEEVVREILPYRRAHSSYGVTLSGGEPTQNWDFYIELLKAFRHHGLHTAVETNGSSARFVESLPYLDLVICDLKHMDPGEHERWTGQANRGVLRTISAVAESGKPLWVRLPVVPGVNDGANIDAAVRFLSPMKDCLCVELIGYHKMGVYKWKALGKKYALPEVKPPDKAALKETENKFKAAGFKVIST